MKSFVQEILLAIVGDIMQFGQILAFFWQYIYKIPYFSIQWAIFLLYFFFENFIDCNESNTEEIWQICKNKENILERHRMNLRLEVLPLRGEIIPGVLDMPGIP